MDRPMADYSDYCLPFSRENHFLKASRAQVKMVAETMSFRKSSIVWLFLGKKSSSEQYKMLHVRANGETLSCFLNNERFERSTPGIVLPIVKCYFLT